MSDDAGPYPHDDTAGDTVSDTAGGPANNSGQRAQQEADQMGMTEDDEHAAKEQFEATGEPIRDRLGNEDGAS